MADFSDLNREIKGTIVCASDGIAYENEINKSLNAAYRDRHPLAFVKVRGKEDVKATVKFCAKHELEVCVSCGGTSPFAMKDEAVVIDMSGMCHVQVDAKNKTAVIEGGAKVADVDEALTGCGLALPLAGYSQLGVAGMMLNTGGQALLARRFGMTCDHVLEFDLVLASGESIKVSSDENPELFWGMKGTHGSSFGVVTSMKFQLNEMSNLVVGGSMFFPFSRAKDVVKMIRDYSVEADDKCLSSYMIIHIRPVGPELIVRLLYCGTLRRGGEVVQDLVDLTHPYKSSCGPVDYCDFQKQGDALQPSGKFSYGVPGQVITELKDVMIDKIFSCVEDIGLGHDFAGSYILIAESHGRKDSQADYEESPFPYRNARYWVGLRAVTKKEENFEAAKDWADHFQEVTSGYSIPLFDGGDAEGIMDKLKNLKQQYDPNNMFHNNLNPIEAVE